MSGAWKVAPASPPPRLARALACLRRLLLRRRAAPTLYQRCLAVHMHFAQHRGGMR